MSTKAGAFFNKKTAAFFGCDGIHKIPRLRPKIPRDGTRKSPATRIFNQIILFISLRSFATIFFSRRDMYD